jgi:triacylglycerol esterase/lipase EstA (alpha/beta hydrolase family)
MGTGGGGGSSDFVSEDSNEDTLRPVLFIHGGAGSASQFESQAQRFMANGYPLSYLGVYEYNTSGGQDPFDPEQAAQRNAQINEIIDSLLEIAGADKIDLIGHSMGTRVSFAYLEASADNADKVANYVSIDGFDADVLPGGVSTLALWGQYVDRDVAGAENVYPDPENPVGHIEVCTSAESFKRIYEFFNESEPETINIPRSEDENILIEGRAVLFPENAGAEGTTLEIYEVDRTTGMMHSDTPDYIKQIDSDGKWGPVSVKNGATYMFALKRDGFGNNHYFYREGFFQDNHFIRLNTSLPDSGVGQYLHRSSGHTNIMVTRDKEFWGDQAESNDVLLVRDTGDAGAVNVVTKETAYLLNRTNTLFLHDRNSDGESSLPGPDPFFSLPQLPFMSGLDLFIPASSRPDQTIRLELTPRGGGRTQVINVANWPSDEVRSVSVLFRDYSEPVRPVVFVHGFSGSASQFESQAQRFMANGYPRSHLAAYDHDTSAGVDPTENAPVTNAAINKIIDSLLESTGADKVDLIAHSRGGRVSLIFLSDPDNAARVAHYVHVDSFRDTPAPDGVDTLALWGEWNPESELEGAKNVHITEQAHIELCTSAESFEEIYRFLNNREAFTSRIVPVPGSQIRIAGAVSYLPQNVGALGTLKIYEVDGSTGFRVSDDPVGVWPVDATGQWGPQNVTKGAAYEFAFEHQAGGSHYFYREPFVADNYFIRLNTSVPGGGTGILLTRTSDSTNIVVTRDKEMWGDQGAENDVLMVGQTNVLTAGAAARRGNLSALFIVDWGYGGHPHLPVSPFNDPAYYGPHVLGETNLSQPIAIFHDQPFLSGVDVHLPGAFPPDNTISLEMTPRGGGASRLVNIPNWASNAVRVSVHFRDYINLN